MQTQIRPTNPFLSQTAQSAQESAAPAPRALSCNLLLSAIDKQLSLDLPEPRLETNHTQAQQAPSKTLLRTQSNDSLNSFMSAQSTISEDDGGPWSLTNGDTEYQTLCDTLSATEARVKNLTVVQNNLRERLDTINQAQNSFSESNPTQAEENRERSAAEEISQLQKTRADLRRQRHLGSTVGEHQTQRNEALAESKTNYQSTRRAVNNAIRTEQATLRTLETQASAQHQAQQRALKGLSHQARFLQTGIDCFHQQVSTHEQNTEYFTERCTEYNTDIAHLNQEITTLQTGASHLVATGETLQKEMRTSTQKTGEHIAQTLQAQSDKIETIYRDHVQQHTDSMSQHATEVAQNTTTALEAVQSHYTAHLQNQEQANTALVQQLNAVVDENLNRVSNHQFSITNDNQTLYSPRFTEGRFDEYSKYALVWRPGGNINNGIWKFIRSPGYGPNVYKIQCTDDHRNLHASGHDRLHRDDLDRRYITTYDSTRGVANERELLWQLIPTQDKDQFQIRSVYNRQYLAYSSDIVLKNRYHDRQHAFTRSLNPVTWTIKKL